MTLDFKTETVVDKKQNRIVSIVNFTTDYMSYARMYGMSGTLKFSWYLNDNRDKHLDEYRVCERLKSKIKEIEEVRRD